MRVTCNNAVIHRRWHQAYISYRIPYQVSILSALALVGFVGSTGAGLQSPRIAVYCSGQRDRGKIAKAIQHIPSARLLATAR